MAVLTPPEPRPPPAEPARLPLPRSLFGVPIFYGWYIVALAFLAAAMSSGISAYSLGIFVTPMEEELGWSRTQLSLGQTASTAGMGVLGLFIGGFLDRRGARGLMVVGAAVAGLGYILLGQVQELWQYYAIQAGVITVGMAGMGAMVVNVAVSNWFVRRRGRAIAISAMGISLTALLLPSVAGWVIEEIGWRSAWTAIGIAIWVVVIPPSWLVMRRRPEDFGLEPDGGAGPRLDAGGEERLRRRDTAVWTRRAAIRTPALWMLTLAFGLGTLGFMALFLHLIPYMTDSGFSRREASAAFGMIGLAGLISKPFWGLFIERVHSKLAAAIEFAMLGVGIVLILIADSLTEISGAIFLFGIGVGGVVTVQEVVWADYFGRITLGMVRSIGRPFSIVFSAGGPVFAGVAYDVAGDYEFAFTIFVATYFLAAILVLVTPEPEPPTEPPTEAPPPTEAQTAAR